MHETYTIKKFYFKDGCMTSKGFIARHWVLIWGLIALSIIVYVLFAPPRPGVADQGDFDRVMFVAGLELMPEDLNNPDFKRFLAYPVEEYKISEFNLLRLLNMPGATSIAYLISFLSMVCKILGQDNFRTMYLAMAYAIMYFTALCVLLRYIGFKSTWQQVLFSLTACLVFFDGNYLVWFNSLYGEPMMIVSLALYASAWVYYIHHRYVLKSEGKLFSKTIFISGAAFLFLGSKLQAISALPVILVMMAWLIWDNRRRFKKDQLWLLGLLGLLLIIYPLGFAYANRGINKETQYNAVFYGILKNSDHPAKDLTELGLNPDMAYDAGKHAFLDKQAYVKYVPHSPVTDAEFYPSISNLKLVRFYLTNPERLIEGMHYTASQAFTTSTFLGKYPQEFSQIPVREFNRFTWWSGLRGHYLPKNLGFILSVSAVFLLGTLIIYFRQRSTQEVKARIKVLWGLILIGLIQFPMPYVGNGEADTAKQLYLFNFVFDIILVVALCWFMHCFIDFWVRKKKRSDVNNPSQELRGC